MLKLEIMDTSEFSLKGLHPLFYQELTAYKDRGVVFNDDSPLAVQVRGEWYARLAKYSMLPNDLVLETEIAYFISMIPSDAVADRIIELAHAFYRRRVDGTGVIPVMDAAPNGQKLDSYILNEYDKFLGPILTETQKYALYWWTFNKFKGHGGKDFLKENN